MGRALIWKSTPGDLVESITHVDLDATTQATISCVVRTLPDRDVVGCQAIVAINGVTVALMEASSVREAMHLCELAVDRSMCIRFPTVWDGRR